MRRLGSWFLSIATSKPRWSKSTGTKILGIINLITVSIYRPCTLLSSMWSKSFFFFQPILLEVRRECCCNVWLTRSRRKFGLKHCMFIIISQMKLFSSHVKWPSSKEKKQNNFMWVHQMQNTVSYLMKSHLLIFYVLHGTFVKKLDFSMDSVAKVST